MCFMDCIYIQTDISLPTDDNKSIMVPDVIYDMMSWILKNS